MVLNFTKKSWSNTTFKQKGAITFYRDRMTKYGAGDGGDGGKGGDIILRANNFF